MAHSVGADVLGDASEAGIFANHRLHTARREAAEVATGVCGTVVATIADEKRVERIMPGAEVGLDLLGSTATDEDWTVFLALTTHHKLAALEVDVVAIEIDKLRDAQTTGEEQLDDGFVAQVGFFAIAWHGINHPLHFVIMEEGDLPFVCLGKLDLAGREAGDVALGEVVEKAAQRDEVVTLGEHAQLLTIDALVAIEPEAVAPHQLGRDLVNRQFSTSKLNEALEVVLVVLRCLRRSATLHLHIFDEVDDQILHIIVLCHLP